MRAEGWEGRLAACIDAARDTAFAWGTHDCATWAFDVRRAMTGHDAAAAWRGRYSTARGAMRMLRRLGAADLAELATHILGAPLARPELAQRGDLVLSGGVYALGVCTGPVGLFLAPCGMTARRLSDCAAAWRV